MNDLYAVEKTDSRFPERLRILPDCPERIFVRGQLPDSGPSAAIVGARMCTSYGRTHARALASYLAAHGVDVISGLALGVDGAAHTGALEGGGRTFAVLGCGADVCYPAKHRKLYEGVITSGGVLSEFPPGADPQPFHFPKRNRIISALADAVIVIEARKKSGSLITADFALEQGKSVYALPGRIGDLLSEGCNALIAQGAGILWNYETILQELGLAAEGPGTMPAGSAAGDIAAVLKTDPSCAAVFEALDFEPRTAQSLYSRTGIPLGDLQSALLTLELAGAAEEPAPGWYARRVK